MQKSQTPKKRLILPGIDYTPAALQKGSNDEWRIVFYALNPYTEKLERIRKRVKPISNKTVRSQFAMKIIAEINLKLSKGWNPFIENESVNAFSKFDDCLEEFLMMTRKKVKDRALREDTLRAYTSYVTNIRAFISAKKIGDIFVLGFNKSFTTDFLEWIYYTKDNSPTTHNNYLQFITTLGNYFISKAYIASNPGDAHKKIRQTEKKRQVIPREWRNKISEHLLKEDRNYYTLCMLTYYCYIRRTELTKLKVEDVNFKKGVIMIPAEVSKNTTAATVTIPKALLFILADHLRAATNNMFLFSSNGFAPGKEQLKPKKISDAWCKMRNQIKLPKVYQFYSLKDTGITDALNNGIPALKVKNQARHSDIKTTEKYTPGNIARRDDDIFNSGIAF